MADKENDDVDFQPPKRVKHAKAKKPGLTERFQNPTSDEAMKTITKGYVPPNTQKNTSWAMTVFNEWRLARNSKCMTEKCPENLFEEPEIGELNRWVSRFITEVRRKDGKPYPPRSVHQLLAGLQRFMLSKKPDAPKFLDRKDPRFRDIHGTCESIYRQLHQQGVGTEVRHAAIITAEEEEALWISGVIGCTTPKNLQRAVFFYIGKRFCIRGGEEQRRLGPSQFIRTTEPDCFTYVEHGSKNRNAGPQQLSLENKEVPCPATPEDTPKCLVFLLDFYLAKLPDYAFSRDILYLRPKSTPPQDSEEPWYENVPVGRNTLGNMVKEMCREAGIEQKQIIVCGRRV